MTSAEGRLKRLARRLGFIRDEKPTPIYRSTPPSPQRTDDDSVLLPQAILFGTALAQDSDRRDDSPSGYDHTSHGTPNSYDRSPSHYDEPTPAPTHHVDHGSPSYDSGWSSSDTGGYSSSDSSSSSSDSGGGD